MTRAPFVLATLAGLLAMTVPTEATHPQAGVTFRHEGGNEWWVELQMGGDPRHDAVEVRDTGGAWKVMTKPSWAPNDQFYAVSYHVEPGHRVQFRASNLHDEVISCWFTHPAGVEQCDGTETGGANFRVLGDGERVQVYVNGTGWTPTSVVWSVHAAQHVYHGGELTKRADGSFARYGTVPSGVILRFHASSAYGDSAHSGCYRWPTITAVTCPSFYSAEIADVWQPQPGTIRAEAWTDSVPMPSRVEVRFDGSSFVNMTKRTDPYTYFERTGVPSTGDHFAEFRVTAPDGRKRCDEDGYYWPHDEPHEAPMYGTDGTVLVREVKGNANWIQANAYGIGVVAVQAQVNGGAWQSLTFQSYCDWAKAISVPSGGTVKLRAFTADFEFHYGGTYAWPPDGSQVDESDVYFDHRGGNEWWVEVRVTGDIPPDSVTACDAQGECKGLTLRSWGNWAGSFHVDGNVRFTAVAYGGMSDIYRERSCWFTHPAGKTPTGGETCGGSQV